MNGAHPPADFVVDKNSVVLHLVIAILFPGLLCMPILLWELLQTGNVMHSK